MIDLADIINKEITYYGNIDVDITTDRHLRFYDRKTGASYTPSTAEAVLRMFRDIGSLRYGLGVL